MERILAAVSAPNRARLMGWLEGRPASGGGYLLKRPLDVLMALLMLLVAAPLFPLIALAIRLEDGGPVFFRQVRWGLDGTRFRVCKFRSMRVQQEQVVQPATAGDDRCTRVGRFLRSMALDELPQLIGVLRGDMSFVGPRPLAVAEARPDGGPGFVEDVPGFFERLVVRPGLTSLATIHVPKDIAPRQKFRYDLLYVRRQSLALDLRLVALSVLLSVIGRWECRSSKLRGLSPSRSTRAEPGARVIRLDRIRKAPGNFGTPRLRRAAAWLIVAAMLIGYASDALSQEAQQASGVEARDELSAEVKALLSADFRLGPLYLRPGVSIGSGVESVPVRGQDRAEATLVGDAVARISPSVQMVLPFQGRHELRATGRLVYNWFYRFEELRNFDKFVVGSYEFEAERVGFTLTNDYRDTQASFLDYVGSGGEGSDPQYDLDQRNRLRQNDLTADLEWQVGHRTYASFRSGHRTYRYDDAPLTGESLAESLDRNVTSIGATGDLQILPRTTVGVSYDYSSADFQAAESFRDHDLHRVAAHVTFDRSAPISGTVGVGHATLTPTLEDRLGYAGIVADGELSVQVGRRALVTVEGGRGVAPTYWTDNIYARADRIGGKVRVPVSTALSLAADIGLTALAYPVPVTMEQFDGTMLTAARGDHITSWGGTISWAKNARESYNLRVGHYDRGSNFDGQSISGWTVGTSITFTH